MKGANRTIMDQKRIYFYGAGTVAEQLLRAGFPPEQITGFVADAPHADTHLGKPFLTPETLAAAQYDAVICANTYSAVIFQQCMQYGIDLNKVVFLRFSGRQALYTSRTQACRLLGETLADCLLNAASGIAAISFSAERTLTRPEPQYENDYVRYRTLELCVNALNAHGTAGSIAEVGVFRGVFSSYLNTLLPDRTLYLFDTFEGFREEEIVLDQDMGVDRAWCESFKDTGTERVLQSLPHRERAVVRKGFFPETAAGLEDERFAFVSLDTDFEQPIYHGLQFFYPRLNRGGYIFVHDYSNDMLKGVRRAVQRFAQETDGLHAVPLCDSAGTLIITK